MFKPFSVDLLLFDLDGTLADTKADLATAVNLTVKSTVWDPGDSPYEMVANPLEFGFANVPMTQSEREGSPPLGRPAWTPVP